MLRIAPERRNALQLQFPGLAHEIDAKAVMRLFRDAAEAGALIDVARGDPADVAGAVASEQDIGPPRGLRRERALDGRHRADESCALAIAEPAEHRRDLVMRALIEFRKRLASLGGQAEPVLPPV